MAWTGRARATLVLVAAAVMCIACSMPSGSLPASSSQAAIGLASPTGSSSAAAPGLAGAQLPPRFEGTVARIGPALRAKLNGRNWHPGCPVPIDALRVVQVSYWTLGHEVARGPLVVNASVARDVLRVFHRLFRARFPIRQIALPPRYRPPRRADWFSTRNLTSSFNCRPATGNPGSLSEHSYGWAIDVNPLLNPYVGPDGKVLRRAALPYLDRSRHVPGMIHRGDVVVRSFAAIGWRWGGDWHTLKDYMHFSLTGR